METQDEDSFLLIAQTVANLLNDGQVCSFVNLTHAGARPFSPNHAYCASPVEGIP